MSEYHRLLCEAIVWQELRHRDEERGAEMQAAGCHREECGGNLDRAFYPRSPRGHGIAFSHTDTRRVSYCCRECRRRHTPVSERFLSHKIYSYISLLVTLVLYSGRSPEVTLQRICAVSGASDVTVRRWRTWIAEFLKSSEWKVLRAQLSALFDVARFPGSLVEQFEGACRSLKTALVATLRFLSVLSRTRYQNILCRTNSNSTK